MKNINIYMYFLLNVFLLVWCLWNAFHYTPYGWVMAFVITVTLGLGLSLRKQIP